MREMDLNRQCGRSLACNDAATSSPPCGEDTLREVAASSDVIVDTSG